MTHDYDAFGAGEWRFADYVPPMAPGDSEVVEYDDGVQVRVTLLEPGVALREVIDSRNGPASEISIMEVPTNYGEIRFRDTRE